ncbi:MAG: GvpL/GvpF family gas vesicle protein [Pikeienuella sp.]
MNKPTEIRQTPIAVTASELAQTACAAGPPSQLSHLAVGPLAILLMPEQHAPLRWQTGRRAARRALDDLLRRQRLLEHLLGYGDVLPVSPGEALTRGEARRFLQANSAQLCDWLVRCAGLVQFQLTIRWDQLEARQRFPGAPGETFEQVAEGLRARFAARIRQASAAVSQLPVEGPEMLANLVLLVDREREDALDDALAALDAVWPQGLRIRLAGPLPPVCFFAVQVDRLTPHGLARDRKALGLGVGELPPRAIDRAFRLRAMALHPDRRCPSAVRPEGADLAALTAARDRLRDAARLAAASGGIAAPADFLNARLEGAFRQAAADAPGEGARA